MIKGPAVFPLDRILAIFYRCVCVVCCMWKAMCVVYV